MTHNQRVLDLLSDGKPHTHHELYALHVVAHSRISDLRKQGKEIAQWTATDNGERVYVYQLVTLPGPAEPEGVAHPPDGTAAAGPGNVDSVPLVPSPEGPDALPPLVHPGQLSFGEAA